MTPRFHFVLRDANNKDHDLIALTYEAAVTEALKLLRVKIRATKIHDKESTSLF